MKIEMTTISRADVGTTLKLPNGRFMVVDRNCYVTNELNQQCHYPSGEDEFEIVHPPKCLYDGHDYTPRIAFSSGGGANYPSILTIAEIGGTCDGYRHRFEISNYGVSVHFLTPSTDPRVGQFLASWTISSGQFWSKLVRASNDFTTFRFTLTDKVNLHVSFGTKWWDVPSQ